MKIYALSYNDFPIEFIADKLINHKEKDLSSYTVVFPGKRPAFYLRLILANKLGSAYYPPKIFSIDEFIKYILEKNGWNRKELDVINGTWSIYNIAKNMQGTLFKKAENKRVEKPGSPLPADLQFEDFFQWGVEFYNVINELDCELVDNDKLNKIKSYRSDVPESVNLHLNNLSYIRDEFHKELEQKGLTTKGYNYIKAANRVESCSLDEFYEFKKIYFVGFIALTKAEAKIINSLLKNDKTEFYTQIEIDKDDIALNLQKSLGNAEIEQYFDANNHDANNHDAQNIIKLYECFDTHSEVKAGFEILANDQIGKPGKLQQYEPQNIAVVLPDPDTLLPFLSHAMNYIDEDYNVTMGYPLKRTPFYALIERILKAQESRFKDKYYARDYISLIKHPYIKGLFNSTMRNFVNKIEKQLIYNGDVFIKLEDVESIEKEKLNKENLIKEEIDNIEQYEHEHDDHDKDEDELNAVIKTHNYFFRNFEEKKITVKHFADALYQAIKLIIKETNTLEYKLSPEYIKRMIAVLETFGDADFNSELMDKNCVFRLFRYYINNETVPFNGIPLKGMQILGMLETRVLKFDKVIVFDCNEGIIPSAKKYDPLLSFNVRSILNMPSYKEHEALYRYHFRRLISGAKESHLIYIKTDKNIRSRFIEEIVWEEEKKAKKLDIEELRPYNLKFKTEIAAKDYAIKKNEKIINNIMSRKLSPTAVDTYLNCPMKFYYSYVIGLKEPEEIEEEIQANKIGTFIHKALKKFYEKFINKEYNYNDDCKKEIEGLIEDFFLKEFKYKEDNGEHFLVKEITKRLLSDFIKEDAEEKPIILEVETEKCAYLPLNNNKNIMLSGFIDRIDKRNGGIFIIDYKTGRAIKPKINKLCECNSESELKGRKKMKELIGSFQLPIYLYLCKNETDALNCEIGISAQRADQQTNQWSDGGGRSKTINTGIDSDYSDYNKLNASIYIISKKEKSDLFDKSKKENINISEVMENIVIPSLKRLIQEILDESNPFIADNSNEEYCNKYCHFSIMCKANY